MSTSADHGLLEMRETSCNEHLSWAPKAEETESGREEVVPREDNAGGGETGFYCSS